MSHQPPTLRELLVHRTFLRKIAGSLLGSDDAAEDATQEVWLEALERPPPHSSNLRGWLRVVVRNLAARRGRQRGEVEPLTEGAVGSARSPLSELERREVHERLGQLVVELDEPYRTVILLRFFEGQSRARIAETLGRPINTVNSQLLRGLERLRAQLDDGCDERGRSWALVLAASFGLPAAPEGHGDPIASAHPGTPAHPRMTAAGVRWAVALAVIVPLTAITLFERSDRSPVEALVGAVPAAPRDALQPLLTGSPSAPRRAPAAPPSVESTGSEPAPERRHWLDVVVVDAEGEPVPGASVLASEPLGDGPSPAPVRGAWTERGLTNAAGHSAVSFPASALRSLPELGARGPVVSVRAVADGSAYSDVVFVPVANDERPSVELVLPGPGYDLVGRVTDVHGDGVRALVRVGEHNLTTRPRDDGSFATPHAVVQYSTDDGWFELQHVPLQRMPLRVEALGFVGYKGAVDGDAWARRHLDVVLREGSRLSGTVRGPGGLPCAAAVVRVEAWNGEDLEFRPEAQSEASGHYGVQGVPEGRRIVRAWHRDQPELRAATAIDFGAADDHAWNPVLGTLDDVHIALSDETGSAAAGWLLIFKSEDPAERWADYQVTDDQGRAAVRNLPMGRIEAALFRSPKDAMRADALPVLWVGGLAAGADPHELVVPSSAVGPGTLSGSLRDDLGQARRDLGLFIRYPGGNFVYGVAREPDAGAFLLTGVAPGRYDLVGRSNHGMEPLGSFQVSPDARTDAGALRLSPPVSVGIRWSWPDTPGYRYALIERDDFEAGFEERTVESGVAPPPAWRELLPGRYRLVVYDGDDVIEERWYRVDGSEFSVATGP